MTVSFNGDWTDFGTQFNLAGPYNLTYANGVEVEWVGGLGPNHFHMVQEHGPGESLSVVQDPTSPRGTAVLQVKVQPGDSCGYSGERAEVSDMIGANGKDFPVTKASGHEFYACSVKLDANWTPPNTQWRWGIFLQLHCPNQNGISPAFAMSVMDDFHVSTYAGDVAPVKGVTPPASQLPFSNGSLRPGQWVQFMIEALWSYDSSGFLKVYRKDVGDTAWTLVMSQTGKPTLQYNSTIAGSQNADPAKGATFLHYWKTGYYRSETPGVTSQLTLGPIVRGTTFESVALAAFSKLALPMVI